VRHILLVEDERAIRTMIEIALEEEEGYRVISASGLDEAEAMLEEERPDLLVLDAVVPGAKVFPKRSGMEFVTFALARDVPVVLMTGFTDLADVLEGVKFPLLRKPFGIDALCDAIGAALARPQENRRRVRDALDYLLHHRAEFAALLERLGELGATIGPGSRRRK